jgi:hypothetical protein
VDEDQVLDRGDEIASETPESQTADDLGLEEQTPAAEAVAEELEDEDDQPRDEKGRFIPKERFDEAVKKERSEKEEAQRRLKEFEDREATRNISEDFAAAEAKVNELIQKHIDLIADGETKEAAAVFRQILAIKDEISERKAEIKAEQTKNASIQENKYASVVEKLEADYPQINPDAAEYDAATVKRVRAYMAGLVQVERMNPSQALKEAVETLLGSPAKAEKPNAAKAEELGLRRKETAVKKAMDAKSKQPASSRDVGLDHDKTGGALDASAVMKMSWDEFVKLPDSKLAELRGDFV